MALPPRFAICPTCNGIHQHVPCPGRRQTEAEWLIDRGVRPERAHAIVTARAELGGLPSLVLPPDPLAPPGPPYGAPAPAPRPTPPAPPAVQEALF